MLRRKRACTGSGIATAAEIWEIVTDPHSPITGRIVERKRERAQESSAEGIDGAGLDDALTKAE